MNRRRPRLLELSSNTSAFARMYFIDDMSYPMSFVLREVGLFFPLFIYFFVGELVGDEPTVGGDYFTFVVIGIAVSTIVLGAVRGFGRSLQIAQDRGIFETFLVEPVPWLFLPFSMNIYRIGLGVVNGMLLLLVGALLGAQLVLEGIPEATIVIMLGILASISIGIVAASLMVLAKRSDPVLTIYGLFATLLGGAFFSVEQLPAWLRVFSWGIPQTYAINGSRAALMEDPGTFVIAPQEASIVLAGFTLVVLPIGLWLFHRALQFAREMGLLSGY